nr:MAG TPA: Protein of unknown function (DUF551) [Caudoviricetes sp.]
MIDEKGLIERFETAKHFLFHDECGRQTISVDKIIDVLKNTEKVGEWIPCSERLPDPDTYVLVTYKDFDDSVIGVDRYDQDIHDWFCFEEGVIAWQPLPEPYREESAE